MEELIKLRKIFIICILLSTCFLFVGSVFATDNSTDNDLSLQSTDSRSVSLDYKYHSEKDQFGKNFESTNIN